VDCCSQNRLIKGKLSSGTLKQALVISECRKLVLFLEDCVEIYTVGSILSEISLKQLGQSPLILDLVRSA
jgi:hypothetical protein